MGMPLVARNCAPETGTCHLNLPHHEPARHNEDVRDVGGVGDVKAVHVVVDVDHCRQGVDVEEVLESSGHQTTCGRLVEASGRPTE